MPVLLAACTVAACTRAPREPERNSDARRPAERVAAAPSSPDRQSSWVRATWAPYSGQDARDRGTGIVYLTAATVGPAPPVPRTDTLIFRAAPAPGSSRVGALLVAYDADGGWRYVVAAPESLAPNLLEYGYEEAGVPTDSADATGRWVRGLLGFTPSGAARRGWAELREGSVGHLRWAEHLREQAVFFLDSAAASFHVSPGGARIEPRALRESAGDYAMYPTEARAPWLRVRVVAPSDLCTGPDTIARAESHYWIRYLDQRGRPLVWYHTRGC